MLLKELKPSQNKTNIAYIWREKHHYFVLFDENNKKPKKQNIAKLKLQKFINDLKDYGWKVYIVQPKMKGL